MSATGNDTIQFRGDAEPLGGQGHIESAGLEMAGTFDRDGFVVLRGFLSQALLSVAYRYLLMKHETGQGIWNDPQAPGTMSMYGDPLMESLLELSTPAMERITGRQLWPTYAYCRLYKRGDVLMRHRDRTECEISATLPLGYDLNAVRQVNPDYRWPIFMDGARVECEPGDVAVYKGCEVFHWREAFEGDNQAQLFLHYIDRARPDADLHRFDGRPTLGLPYTAQIPSEQLRQLPPNHRETFAQLGQLARTKKQVKAAS